MAHANVHKTDFGIIFEATIKDNDHNVVNLMTATTKDFIFKKPNGDVVAKAASFTGDGSDGKIRYTFESGLLDYMGYSEVQVHIGFPNADYHSDIQKMNVIRNL